MNIPNKNKKETWVKPKLTILKIQKTSKISAAKFQGSVG